MDTHISETDQQLIEKIMRFELDDPVAALSFTGRLAREQGWTHAFSAQVIQEYRHFIALAMVAGHPVTPSEEVDQVWHLHLVYTRSYWHDLCRDLLGRDLHHGPTKGGNAEGEKFHDWYAQTLASYQRIFSKTPPPMIWPSPTDRFTNASAGRWVDSSKFWLLPRPRLWQKLFRKL